VAIALHAGATVRGIVKAPGSLDLRKVTLSFLERDTRKGPTCKIADDASYVALGFAPGRYFIHAVAPEPVAVERARELVIPSGVDQITLDLSLVAAGTLHVEVHDHRLASAKDRGDTAVAPQQRATASSSLVALEMPAGSLVHEWRTITDGFFSALDLRPGDYLLRLSTDESSRIEKTFTIEAGKETDVVLEPR